MKIIKANEQDLNNLKSCVYCIVFSTGHFYIGSSENFKSRQYTHTSNIKKKIGIFNFLNNYEDKISCKFVILSRNYFLYNSFIIEKNLIFCNANNPFLINQNKGKIIYEQLNNKIWQNLKDLSADQ